MKKLAMFFILMMFLNTSFGQTTSSSPIIFIYDASGSMWGQLQGKTKMQIASGVMTDAIQKLPEGQQIGLVAYGHRQKSDCRDVEFLVDFQEGNKSKVIESVNAIKPLGMTPLAHSASLVIDQLRSTKTKATIILVTDGIESCDGNICDIVKAAKAEGIDFRLHIVGFGLKEGETAQLECAAEAGDGKYFGAGDTAALMTSLDEATETTVDKPKFNFSLYAVKNGKPIDALFQAYLEGSKGKIKSSRTYGDTSYLYLSPNKYYFEVEALGDTDFAPIYIYNIESFDDRIVHQTVSFDGGKMIINTLNNGLGWDAAVKIFQNGTKTIAASTRTYGKETEFELNPGLYDIEILAMGIDGVDNLARIDGVEIKSKEDKSEVHDFETGIALIGAKSAEGLVDASVTIKEVNSKRNVAGKRTYTSAENNPKKFILSIGTYEVTVAALGKYGGKKETFTMVIKKGDTFEKILNF
jgi:Ca-activated chloride channel family protein